MIDYRIYKIMYVHVIFCMFFISLTSFFKHKKITHMNLLRTMIKQCSKGGILTRKHFYIKFECTLIKYKKKLKPDRMVLTSDSGLEGKIL